MDSFMASARRHLSLNALRAFEAAARHRHMARAAEELGVTHGAVSRHVRLLEQDLAVALFDRRHNRIRLTAEGARLFPVVREALDRVTTAALGLGGGPPAGRLTVACTPTLATSFLIPALDGFRSRYPALDLDLRIAPPAGAALAEDIDLALVYGLPRAAGRRVVKLTDVAFFPVWSSKYANQAGTIRGPDDLAGAAATLLHDDEGGNWARWFEAAGRSLPSGARGIRFGAAFLSLEAARAGLGVALAGRLEVTGDLAEGRLMSLPEVGVPAPQAYYLVTAAEPGMPRRVAAFESWLRAQLG